MVIFISHCANNYKSCINLLNSYSRRLQIDLNHESPHKFFISILTAATMARTLPKLVLLLAVLFIIVQLIESKPYFFGNVNNPGAIVFEEPTNLFEVHTLSPDENEDYFSNLIDDRFSNNDAEGTKTDGTTCVTKT